MSKNNQAALKARTLFNTCCDGVLSTHSIDLPGYPFGSITPYCFNRHGQAVILISTIAQHTKNIKANNKVSLIAFDDATDSQAAGRVTYIGDAKPVNDDEIAERYYRFFPDSRNFHKTHDFNFYLIEFVRARYIGGFGQIFWVENSDFIKANPFSFEEETGMVDHMNADHLDAIRHYCDLFDITYNPKEQPTLVGVDSEGFHLRVKGSIYRLGFNHPVSNTSEARAALVELARRPK
jgi:putative heme iron utilization protein